MTTTDAINASFAATVAAVPEPATWSLMISGFGLVGLSMRARKLTATTIVSA